MNSNVSPMLSSPLLRPEIKPAGENLVFDMEAHPVFLIDNLSFSRDSRLILRDINLKVNYGEFVAVTGPNGGGKTTLLRLILKLLRPDKGTVSYFSKDGEKVTKLNIGYLPQKNMIDSKFPVTVEEVVSFGLLSDHSLSKRHKKERVYECLDLCGMSDYVSHPIGKLSGGQLQRTLLARAIVSMPELLILDEPLSFIDKQFEPRLYDIISDLSKKGLTIILVSHEMTHISAMASRHLLVDRTIHECGAKIHYHPSTCC